MVEEFVTQIMREALYLTLVVSGPPIIVSLVIGLIISLFQAVTQLQEQTITFVPKIVVVFIVIAILGPWMGKQMVQFTHALFSSFATVVR